MGRSAGTKNLTGTDTELQRVHPGLLAFNVPKTGKKYDLAAWYRPVTWLLSASLRSSDRHSLSGFTDSSNGGGYSTPRRKLFLL
jgi:hypothetical protein